MTKHSYQGRWYLTMKDVVLHEMITTQKDNKTRDFLRRFEERITFTNGSKIDLAKNITDGIPVLTDHGWRMLSRKFALISTPGDMRPLLAVLKLLTKYIIIFSKIEVEFKFKVPWMGRRSFFLGLARARLGWLEQSGIYDR